MKFWLTVAINVRSVQCSYTCENIALTYIFKMFLLSVLSPLFIHDIVVAVLTQITVINNKSDNIE